MCIFKNSKTKTEKKTENSKRSVVAIWLLYWTLGYFAVVIPLGDK